LVIVPTHYRVVSDTYYDSVQLMRVVSDVTESMPVENAGAVMGTPANRDRLQEAGTLTAEAVDGVGPDDLVVTASAPDADDAQAAIDEMVAMLDQNRTDSDTDDPGVAPKSIRRACANAGSADLALVSVPGEYAGLEAWNALREGLHVHLFSDDVPVEVERDLKEAARGKDRLLMGPDCGTAIIDGLPLGFANEVPDGPVGVVSASGTGLQAVTCRLARRGVGVSQAIGTGGRDLSEAVEGLTTRTALARLDDDDSTGVIVLLSKPPAESAVAAVAESIRACSTPVVVHFQGADASAAPGGATGAETLASTADRAISVADLSADDPPSESVGSKLGSTGDGEYIRGLFTGGTLCVEAALLAAREGAAVQSNVGIGTALDWSSADGHTFVDFGADDLTDGRPHPMIDPSLRNEHLEAALAEDSAAVVLLDVVLGYGAHDDPAGAVADVVAGVESETPVVASVVGTEADLQSRSEQIRRLEDAGVVVAESNVDAARLAARAASLGDSRIEEGSA